MTSKYKTSENGRRYFSLTTVNRPGICCCWCQQNPNPNSHTNHKITLPNSFLMSSLSADLFYLLLSVRYKPKCVIYIKRHVNY